MKIEFDITHIQQFIAKREIKYQTEASRIIQEAISDSLKRLVMPSIEREIRSDLTNKAEHHAIDVLVKIYVIYYYNHQCVVNKF